MSRRRRRPDPSQVESTDVRVVCTGRRTHAEFSFGVVIVFPHGGEALYEVRPEEFLVHEGPGPLSEAHIKWPFDVPPLESDPVIDQLSFTYTFVCPRCRVACGTGREVRRNVPLKRHRLRDICQKLAEAGTPKLDISALGAADC